LVSSGVNHNLGFPFTAATNTYSAATFEGLAALESY
jgi:hypothetical protein